MGIFLTNLRKFIRTDACIKLHLFVEVVKIGRDCQWALLLKTSPQDGVSVQRSYPLLREFKSIKHMTDIMSLEYKAYLKTSFTVLSKGNYFPL